MSEWIPLAEARTTLPKVSGLYIVRNTESGKEYVGLSSNVRMRVSTHVRAGKNESLLHRAIKKHGVAKFEVCLYILAEISELPELEMILIDERRTVNPFGYNITSGGEGTYGRRHTDSAKQKIREARLGKPMSQETKDKLSAGAPALWTQEMREMVSKQFKGKKKSAEARAKQSAVNRARDPSIYAAVGRKTAAREITEESRKRRSDAAKNRYKSKDQRENQSIRASKSILAIIPECMIVMQFKSGREAAEWSGKSATTISNYCYGRIKSKDGVIYYFDE